MLSLKRLRFSLSTKQMAIFMFVSTCSLLLTASIFYVLEMRLLKQSVTEDLTNEARLMADILQYSIFFKDKEEATDALASFERNLSIKSAIVYDEVYQDVFATYYRDGVGESNIEHVKKEVNTEVEMFSDHAEISYPIYSTNELQGILYMEYDLIGLKLKAAQYRNIVLTVFVISLLFAAFLTQRLEKFITGPIQKLAGLADEVTDSRDYSKRLEIARSDELGSLINGFNNMLAAIEERDTRLQNHTQHLEEEVRIRTEHLEQQVQLRTEQLHKRAYYDELTGLPNRHYLFDHLKMEISRSKREGRQFSLLFLDLDRFKTINDSLGHYVGDELLKEAALRLKDTVRVEDLVARIGGDEFVVLITNLKRQENVTAIVETIISRFSEPYELVASGVTLHISVSIGISIYPKDGEDINMLMRNADTSMYESKSTGPGQYKFYEESMSAATHRQLQLENQLLSALKNSEFEIYYQPQISIDEFKVSGMEALIRWNNPVLGSVSPSEFIPFAENIGIINDIGLWVIERVCLQYMEWQKEGLPDTPVSVNVSASQLHSNEFVEFVQNVIQKYQVGARSLVLEITEDVFLDNSERIYTNLKRLRELGHKIAIDDFGTGYSSLSYLQRFPVDYLKLDGSFMDNFSEKATSKDLIAATISLTHSLRLKMIAESVETEAQCEFLRAHGCDIVQGYYFSRPLPKDDVVAFYNSFVTSQEGIRENLPG